MWQKQNKFVNWKAMLNDMYVNFYLKHSSVISKLSNTDFQELIAVVLEFFFNFFNFFVFVLLLSKQIEFIKLLYSPGEQQLPSWRAQCAVKHWRTLIQGVCHWPLALSAYLSEEFQTLSIPTSSYSFPSLEFILNLFDFAWFTIQQ